MIKLLKNFTKKEWILSIFVLLLVLLQVGLELKMPDYMSTITKLVQTEGSKMSDILINGLYMTLCAFGSMFGAIITGYLTSTISANFSRNTRKKVFSKVESFSMKEIKKFSTNSLITRTTNDITQIQMLLAGGLMLIIRVPITVVWAITKILNKNWQWSLITGIAVFALLTMVTIIGIIVIPRFKIIQKLIDKINGVTRENLNGIRVVRAFNAEKYQEDKFENVNSELADKQLTIQRTFCIFDPVMFLVMYGLTLGIYFVGAKLIQEANMMDKIALFGDMVVFSSYAMQVIISFLMLAMIFMMLPRAQVSANRIREILDEEISIKDGSFDGNTEEKGTIIFKDVSFKYPDAEECLLDNISFEINKGETVAFIGSTGSGKSTLINLIPRFYDVTSGEVLVDGVNVKEYKQEKLFNKIGYVSQKAILFNGTISENVDYGTNGKEKISKKEIEEAIEIAQAKEFVYDRDEKLAYKLSQIL